MTLIKLRAKRGETLAAKLSGTKDIDEQNKIIETLSKYEIEDLFASDLEREIGE